MADNNQTRFFWARFETALQHFDKGDTETTDDICCELVSDFACPRFCQIQAYQLRSVCTQDYWSARHHLEEALKVIHGLPLFGDKNDHKVQEFKSHTEKMLGQVMGKLAEKYGPGRLPEEQPIEEILEQDRKFQKEVLGTRDSQKEHGTDDTAFQSKLEKLSLGEGISSPLTSRTTFPPNLKVEELDTWLDNQTADEREKFEMALDHMLQKSRQRAAELAAVRDTEDSDLPGKAEGEEPMDVDEEPHKSPPSPPPTSDIARDKNESEDQSRHHPAGECCMVHPT